MDCSVKPLGHRLLITPDACVDQTTSGILIPEAYNNIPPMSGIVQAVGCGHLRDRRIRTATIARSLSLMTDAQLEAATPEEAILLWKDEMARYLRDASQLDSVAAVGQRVIFPMDAGHELVLGEDAEHPLVIVSEDSVLAVYDTAEEQVAS